MIRIHYNIDPLGKFNQLQSKSKNLYFALLLHHSIFLSLERHAILVIIILLLNLILQDALSIISSYLYTIKLFLNSIISTNLA
jgi:hypothetical protein